MMQTIGWVLFAFTVWGLAILLHALQRRFAPNMGSGNWHGMGGGTETDLDDDDDDGYSTSRDTKALRAEVERLRQRVEVLETIVTDKKYQFDQELKRS